MTGILNALIAGVSGAVKDTYFNLVSLLLPGNGTNGAQNNTFLDSSTNNFTITRNGNTTQGTFSPFSQTGWGNYFNGSNASLSVNVSGIAAGTSTFTLEMWVYMPAYPASEYPLVDTRSTNGATTTAFLLGIYNSGAIKFYDGTETNLGGAVQKNQWTHLALVRNSSNVVTAYINGVATGTTVSSTRNFSDNYFWIASYAGPAGTYFGGYISNLRWVVGTAVYTGTFTPSTTPLTAITNTVLLTCQSNRFFDANTQLAPKTITVSGSPTVIAFSPFAPTAAYTTTAVGGSGYFDGTGDYLSLTGSSLGSGNFTVEGWVYLTTSGTTGILFDSRASDLSSSGFAFYRSSSNYLSLFTNGVGSAGTTEVPINSWTHVALVRNSGTIYGYMNGILQFSVANTATMSLTSWKIFAQWDNTNTPAGYLSSFRITTTAVYSGTSTTTPNFTLPTSPLTAIANTSLLLNFTNAGIYDATSKNDLETVGNAQISTTQSKWGGGSMYFDGTGDYLVPSSASSNILLGFGTGDFTIEFWVYFAGGLGSDILLYDGRPLSTNGAYPTIYVNSSSQLSYVVSSADRITSSSAFSTSIWYHIAVSRSGTSTKMFVNGTQVGSTYTDSTNYLSAARRPTISINGFNESAGGLNGYIDDLRVSRVARYTSNFTAPTAPFPVQ